MATVLSLDAPPVVVPALPPGVGSLLVIRAASASAEQLLRDAAAAQGLRLLACDLAGSADHGIVIAAEIEASGPGIAALAAMLARSPGIHAVSVAEVGAARVLRHNAASEEQP
jgi:hypothetical protein